MQSGMSFTDGMNNPEDIQTPHDVGFHVSLLYTPAQGLETILKNVEDLLFVLDEHGRILKCKSRSGAELNTHPLTDPVKIEDILPETILQKYKLAIERYRLSGKFTLFEGMLTLLPNKVDWYEFRLIPALRHQLVLFIWNVNHYRKRYWTAPNVKVSVEKMIEGWSRSLYLRDFETEDHTRRVTKMTIQLARRLELPEGEMMNIRRGAQVHDIGKIVIPDEILLKTEELTKEEWDVMRQHTLIAVGLLKLIPQIEPALVIPRSHHEKWDGSGYPDGLAGTDIPLQARIFAFADVYDALTSDRPYRRAWSRADALRYIHSESGRHFDPSLAPKFIHMMLE